MNDESRTQQACSDGLTDDELELVVGGSGDANDPVGTATGAVDPDLKATPILF
jgi:hypothetical protein